MKILKNTMSVCEHCYRHTPAKTFERGGAIWMYKVCKEHGPVEHVVEPDADFYLNYNYQRHPLGSYLLEVTNRCNLACPHCYQEPDNLSKDLPISYYLDLIKRWPDNGYPVALCGAEPTVRKDLPEFIAAIQAMSGKPRDIMVLTNGVKFSNKEYVAQFQQFDNLVWGIGLNHPDYQGHTVRNKQIQGIENCKQLGLTVKNIGYTLEGLHQLEYCLQEIQDFGNEFCKLYRIRVGAEIGRHPDALKLFLSDLFKATKQIADKHNWSFEDNPNKDGCRAHYPIKINGIDIKLIQWPDAGTLDLREIQTEAISDILPGKPPSPLIHQVILRDGAVNRGLPLWDTVPQEYIDNYGY